MDGVYPIGPNGNAIFLEVTVSTPGEVTSIAWELRNGNRKEVASNDIDDPTGKIQKTNIGSASLAGSDIEIRSIIDLSLVHPTLWISAYANLSVLYDMCGGIANQQFQCEDSDKSKNDSGSLIRVIKIIHITN
jgi:hypothetical protein